MKKAIFDVIYFLICLFLVLLTNLLINNKLVIKIEAAEIPEIVINEIMYNPAGADSGHQWIEIVNVSTSTDYIINDDWRFNDGSNHLLTVVQGDEVINPNEYLVMAENDEIFLQDYPDYQGSLIDTVISLNNEADTLSLSIDGGQTFFATTTYQDIWGGDDNGYSLERIEFSDNWQQSYILGGTPGQENSLAPTNSPPIVEIIGQATGTVNQSMEFTASSTNPNGDELSFLWNFGDQATSSGQTVSHSYNQAGQFLILLTAFDGQLSATNTLPVTIEEIEEVEDDEEDNIEQYSNQIIVNEILPNPVGPDDEDEFIELYNRSQEPINLNGWQLSDATARRYVISANYFHSTIIPAFGYFVIYRKDSGITLNNIGDSIELYQPNGNLLNYVSYFDSAKSGWAYAKSGGSFIWTFSPTPGQQNIIKTDEEENSPLPENDYAVQEIKESKNPSFALRATEDRQESKNVEIYYNPADYQGLKINEFMANPAGPDSAEWIELYNNSSSTLNLNGFQLDDEEGGSRPYGFDASTTIGAFNYLIINREKSKIALNNSQDAVRLIAPDGKIFREVIYDKAKEDWSYNFDEIDEEWFWSKSSTPGQKNVTFIENFDGQVETSAEEEIEFPYYPLAEIKDLGKGTKVQTVGTVIAPPGLLGKLVMYIAESGSGIQLYSSSGEFPNLRIGDTIEIKGRVSEIQGEKRINLTRNSQIKTVDYSTVAKPELINIEDLTDDLVGSLIYISGELVEKKGSNYYLDDGTGEIKVYIKESSGIKKPEVKEGYYMDVQGVLTLTKTDYRLLPRFDKDINVGQILGEQEEVKLSKEENIIKADEQKKKVVKYLLFGGGSIVVILISLIIRYKYSKIN